MTTGLRTFPNKSVSWTAYCSGASKVLISSLPTAAQKIGSPVVPSWPASTTRELWRPMAKDVSTAFRARNR